MLKFILIISTTQIICFFIFLQHDFLFYRLDYKYNLLKMIDESLYDYLQLCIIQHFKATKKTTEEIHHTLDNLGFRVGYSLIEK